MKTWLEDQFLALLTAKCEHELFEMIISLARDLDFDYCAYGLRIPLSVTQPKIVMFNNYSAAWQKRYQENNYLAVDPTVQHGIRSSQPIIWHDGLFTNAREFWEEARSFGLHAGCAQSSKNASSCMVGMLSLARSTESISDAEFQDKKLKIAWLTQMAHMGMSRLLTAKLMPDTESKLSDREIEVLRWTADGKVSAEISDILNIAERTVNFHIGNAMLKLDAPNKTAAVIRAAMLGLLY
jgi:LuxR family transcriptional regulator